VIAAGLLAACSDPAVIRELRGPTMGSRYIVKFIGGPDTGTVRGIVQAVLQEYDRTFSLWREDSEIAAVNRYRGGEPLPVSARFRAVLELALEVARRSDGAFDPTVRPLSALWQRQRNGGEAPTAAERAGAVARVGWQRLRLCDAGLVKQPEQEIDLDGLVAGACADELAVRLRERGVGAAMLDVTGEVLCFGRKPGGEAWEIAMPGPDGRGPTVRLLDEALCSSGSTENFLEQGGVTRCHIFDPRTGDNLVRAVTGVSVLARSCGLADALDTALMVVGPEGAEALLQGWAGEAGPGALFLLRQPDGSLVRQAVRWPPEKK
jgi:thiamine biosynthesis lipoprotein